MGQGNFEEASAKTGTSGRKFACTYAATWLKPAGNPNSVGAAHAHTRRGGRRKGDRVEEGEKEKGEPSPALGNVVGDGRNKKKGERETLPGGGSRRRCRCLACQRLWQGVVRGSKMRESVFEERERGYPWNLIHLKKTRSSKFLTIALNHARTLGC